MNLADERLLFLPHLYAHPIAERRVSTMLSAMTCNAPLVFKRSTVLSRAVELHLPGFGMVTSRISGRESGK